jgi:hypothetical protein
MPCAQAACMCAESSTAYACGVCPIPPAPTPPPSLHACVCVPTTSRQPPDNLRVRVRTKAPPARQHSECCASRLLRSTRRRPRSQRCKTSARAHTCTQPPTTNNLRTTSLARSRRSSPHSAAATSPSPRPCSRPTPRYDPALLNKSTPRGPGRVRVRVPLQKTLKHVKICKTKRPCSRPTPRSSSTSTCPHLAATS